jgi:hypothetical protein
MMDRLRHNNSHVSIDHSYDTCKRNGCRAWKLDQQQPPNYKQADAGSSRPSIVRPHQSTTSTHHIAQSSDFTIERSTCWMALLRISPRSVLWLGCRAWFRLALSINEHNNKKNGAKSKQAFFVKKKTSPDTSTG